MKYYIERILNDLKRPKTPEGIAKKIAISIKHKTINCCINSKFTREIGFDKMDDNAKTGLLRDMVINGICFSTMTFQDLAAVTKSSKYSRLYEEIAIEVRSSYGNYLKARNNDSEEIDNWNAWISDELDNFNLVFQKNKKELKPMPENNPWVYVSIVVMLAHLRQTKINKKDPLFPLLVDWIQEIEKNNFKTLEAARL